MRAYIAMMFCFALMGCATTNTATTPTTAADKEEFCNTATGVAAQICKDAADSREHEQAALRSGPKNFQRSMAPAPAQQVNAGPMTDATAGVRTAMYYQTPEEAFDQNLPLVMKYGIDMPPPGWGAAKNAPYRRSIRIMASPYELVFEAGGAFPLPTNGGHAERVIIDGTVRTLPVIPRGEHRIYFYVTQGGRATINFVKVESPPGAGFSTGKCRYSAEVGELDPNAAIGPGSQYDPCR